MKVHELKIDTKYFVHVCDGTKSFEIRKNDRGFKVGEVVRLSELDSGEFTGRYTTKVIDYITDYEQKDGYVVFSIRPLTIREKYLI